MKAKQRLHFFFTWNKSETDDDVIITSSTNEKSIWKPNFLNRTTKKSFGLVDMAYLAHGRKFVWISISYKLDEICVKAI